MKNQTPRLDAKIVNANLYRLQENTGFSSVVADIRFRGVASLNQVWGTILEWGNRRSEVQRADSRG